jgi:hypothetical protein
MKSHNVEDAVLEVIDLLCGPAENADEDLQTEYSNEGLDFEPDESDG